MARDPLLPDGSYDAIVVDAEPVETGPSDEGRVLIELTIVAGAHKGELVALHAPADGRDPIDLMGLPATLTVADGSPHLEIES